MEDENHTGKNISDLLESKKHGKRSKYEGINESRKNRSTINRKYSERYKENDIFNNKINTFLFNILILMQYVYYFFLYFAIIFKAPTS